MKSISNKDLIEKAQSVVISHPINNDGWVGDVGSALLTQKGNIYLGVCIVTACGMGFCAEHNAIGSMITNGEYQIKKIVAVLKDGTVLPPCGRCREFMHQIQPGDVDVEVVLSEQKTVNLKELLPHPWS